MRKVIFFYFVIVLASFAQTNLENYQSSVYDFLNRMSIKRIIDANKFAKPYSIEDIIYLIKKIDASSRQLSYKEREELQYYRSLYLVDSSFENPKKIFELKYSIKDTAYSFFIKPIFGLGSYYRYGEGQFRRYWGFEIKGHFSKWFSFQSDFRDNWEHGAKNLNRYKIFVNETYPLLMKSEVNYIEYSEAKGAAILSNEWIRFGVVKENFIWGNGSNSQLIFSSRAPSFPAIYLELIADKWLRFYYLHGWLISRVEDTSRTYRTPVNGWNRRIERKKYLAAHALEIRPYDNLSVTLGETIIYSDMDIQINYLLPFTFYRSVDHSYEGSGGYATGNNGSFFIDAAYFPINGLKLYGTFFVDEFSLSLALEGKNDRNQTAYQIGFQNYGLIDNLLVTFEYAKILPWVYSNYVPAQTYTHAGALLGHYIGQNSDQIWLSIDYRFSRAFKAKTFLERTRNGEFGDLNFQYDLVGEKFLYGKKRIQTSAGLEFTYENWGSFATSFFYRYDYISDEDAERTPSWILKNKNSFGIFVRYGF